MPDLPAGEANREWPAPSTGTDEPHRVVQFSCGAPSAVAAKLTLADHDRNRVMIVNAFIQEEDADNRRFLDECQMWLGMTIFVMRDKKYNASTDEVWKRKRFMKGPNGAPCSLELKRKLLASIIRPEDIAVIGFTAEEADRLDDLRENFPSVKWEAPLIERNLTRADCLTIIRDAGIDIPRMYRLGYSNANCIGCPKGGQAYWQSIREDFPQRFAQVKAIQESIGPGAFFLRFRSGPRKNERMSLSELPEGRGDLSKEPDFSCSFFCEMAKQDMCSTVSTDASAGSQAASPEAK